MVTAVAAFLAGAGLFAIAARGARAGTIHFLTGNMASALIVGSLAFACFVAALTFLMPGRLRRVVRAGEQPRLRPLVRLGAICVLFVLLIGAAVTDRAAGERILGLVPHTALWPVALAFAILFTLAFILPGLAYRTDPVEPSPVPSVPRAPRPLPKLAWSVKDLRSPALRRVLQAAFWAYIALVGFAFYAWAFTSVLPDPSIIEANRKYIIVTILLSTLVMGLPIVRARLSDGARDRLTHFRVKVPIFLGLLMFNGLAAVNLPERALPIAANWVLGHREESREVLVVEAKPRSGQRGCGAKIVVLLTPETGRRYDLCHMPKSIAEAAHPGDTLLLQGQSAGYGLVLERATLKGHADQGA